MTIMLSNTLDGSTGVLGFVTAEAIGVQNFGSLAVPPELIPGRLDFSSPPGGGIGLHSQCYVGDPLNVGGTRAEITLGEDALLGSGVFNTPFWYCWEMYIPSSWPQTGNPYTVMQIHDWPDNGDPAAWPNFELMIKNDSLIAKTAADLTQKSESGTIDFLPARVQFDKWVPCALFAKWDKTGNTGWMELYYNDVKVDGRWFIRSNRATTKGPYCRLGVYDCNHYLDFGKLEAWYRKVVWRDGADGYVSTFGRSQKSRSDSALMKI